MPQKLHQQQHARQQKPGGSDIKGSPQPSHPHPFQSAPLGVPAARQWPPQRFTPPAAAQPQAGASLQGGPVQGGPGRLDSAAVAQKIAEALPQLGLAGPAAVAAAQAAAAAAVSVLQEQQEMQRQQVSIDSASRRCTGRGCGGLLPRLRRDKPALQGQVRVLVVQSCPCASFQGRNS